VNRRFDYIFFGEFFFEKNADKIIQNLSKIEEFFRLAGIESS